MSKPRLDPYSLETKPAQSYLLELVKQDAMRNLEEEVMEIVRPRVREIIKKAFLGVEPAIESMFDPMRRELAIRLTVKDNQ